VSLQPWAKGPFELLLHAETHLLNGDDFDRRIALISFDDAVEVAITTYLTLNPIQRGGRTYPKADVEKWLGNYYTKLDFLEAELSARSLKWTVEKSYIIWAHDHRNEQYHGGQKGTPEKNVLKVIREAAVWIFSLLFDIGDVDILVAKAIVDSSPQRPPKRERNFDTAIDGQYGLVQIGEQEYYTSELLFATDYDAYRELGTRLCNPGPGTEEAAGTGEQP
jgi:hypothetical protein